MLVNVLKCDYLDRSNIGPRHTENIILLFRVYKKMLMLFKLRFHLCICCSLSNSRFVLHFMCYLATDCHKAFSVSQPKWSGFISIPVYEIIKIFMLSTGPVEFKARLLRQRSNPEDYGRLTSCLHN